MSVFCIGVIVNCHAKIWAFPRGASSQTTVWNFYLWNKRSWAWRLPNWLSPVPTRPSLDVRRTWVKYWTRLFALCVTIWGFIWSVLSSIDPDLKYIPCYFIRQNINWDLLNTYGNFARGWTELLVETSICANPKIVMRDFQL